MQDWIKIMIYGTEILAAWRTIDRKITLKERSHISDAYFAKNAPGVSKGINVPFQLWYYFSLQDKGITIMLQLYSECFGTEFDELFICMCCIITFNWDHCVYGIVESSRDLTLIWRLRVGGGLMCQCMIQDKSLLIQH